MKNLVVNVYYDISFDSFDLIEKSTTLLDFSGKLSARNGKVLNIYELSDYNVIYKSSLNEFVSFAADLSEKKLGKKNVRDFLFRGLPIYWLTDISLKHPHLHFLLNLIIFKNTVVKHPELFRNFEKVTILTHKKNSFTVHFLKDLPIKLSYHVFRSKNDKRKFKVLKSIIRNSLGALKQKKIKESGVVSDFLIIYPNNMTAYSRAFFVQISKIIKDGGKKLFSLPYFPFMKSNNFGDFNVSIKLTVTDIFIIITNIFVLKFSVFFSSLFSNHPETSFLKTELNNVFENDLYFLFMYFGLKKLSNKTKTPTKVFFENEFYKAGRVISMAFSTNKFAKTYGIQHAVFLPEHTVYTITDTEINDLKKDDGLPVPDRFIVWGNYFKKIFLKNNSLGKDYVIPAGNLSYINISKTQQKSNKSNRILYCLTTENIFKKEVPIIKNLIETTKGYTVIFRFHPLWNFDKKIIEQSLGIKPVNISNEKNIKNEIKQSDIIITSAHSSVFLDAVVYNKPVLRLITKSDSLPDNLHGIYNCRTAADFSGSFQKLSSNNTSENSYSEEFLTMGDSGWKKIIY